ncbi:hypothetical protein B8b_016 [Pseudoalteromonas phage B8b]|uniref:Acb2/Tad1 hairpin domain-containing protein n=1 Tax=Pseudoalteromonas phage B8b TaxID=1506997 RepID=A0A076G7K2_9CAUD|nr:hypothetical protein B8b_016 [Pseudoalteromonas phage B8b]|tara:strand:+ start:685 stop:909 length:225 start_codon:yes stop_codon:yes gene_type:complete
MENQHRKITGYRELTQQDVNDMNDIKAEGERLKTVIAAMRSRKEIDQRWVSIAETHLQQGIMAAVRAVAQPNSF